MTGAPAREPDGAPVAIVGVTTAGKSACAMAVARAHRGVEIVSVDSMCVYRGMDIGTGKPSPEARAEVRHHLIDLVDPDETFTVLEFQQAAAAALADIAQRGQRALLVGGTGLYLRAVIDGLTLPGRWPEVAADLRRQLAAEGPDGLRRAHERLARLDPVAAARIDPANERRLVRALEVTLGSGRPFSSYGGGLTSYPPTRFALVGLPYEREETDRRIARRFDAFIDAGLLDEVRALAGRPGGLSLTARQALGYRELLAHCELGLPLDECVERAVTRTRLFARRQWKWFSRDPRIAWVAPGSDPVQAVGSLLGPPR